MSDLRRPWGSPTPKPTFPAWLALFAAVSLAVWAALFFGMLVADVMTLKHLLEAPR
jgi:hypothetical protein